MNNCQYKATSTELIMLKGCSQDAIGEDGVEYLWTVYKKMAGQQSQEVGSDLLEFNQGQRSKFMGIFFLPRRKKDQIANFTVT